MKLEGRIAIVTGGASGIGEATVREFVRQGAKVVIADLSEAGSSLSSALNAEGFDTTFMRADVKREADIQNVVTHTVAQFGGLDIMVANAGIGQPAAPIGQLALDCWQQLVDINLTGVFLSNKHAIGQMQRQGRGGAVVNVASVLGHVGMPGVAAYNAAKGGVVNLTRALGVAHAREGIRVNAICPGFIDTPILAQASAEARQRIIAAHPIGRLGRAEEIAKAICFLASDDASFVAGANLIADGGYTAQ
ncbi:short-chain dehydrogenase [Cupriavidus sp. TKC]|uniref:SDR family NAD(P)-dependent oxidoreductase n=1 Tax=Cupriavidus sp. TKC TaxID=2880159 RepID=UPI0025A6FCFC|nr:glucose 1-dehydrogenase [Cupriavidus sp. TKC]GMG90530.1 short-chain dehydrogenase [Cupriavidus sp. TKC]